MRHILTEDQFAQVGIKGLDEAAIAILRKDCGLPYDEEVLRSHVAVPVLERRLWMLAWAKADFTKSRSKRS